MVDSCPGSVGNSVSLFDGDSTRAVPRHLPTALLSSHCLRRDMVRVARRTDDGDGGVTSLPAACSVAAGAFSRQSAGTGAGDAYLPRSRRCDWAALSA